MKLHNRLKRNLAKLGCAGVPIENISIMARRFSNLGIKKSQFQAYRNKPTKKQKELHSKVQAIILYYTGRNALGGLW